MSITPKYCLQELYISIKSGKSQMLSYCILISLDGAGNWSTEGCRTIIVDSTSDLVMCECNHLTNFGCLVVS